MYFLPFFFFSSSSFFLIPSSPQTAAEEPGARLDVSQREPSQAHALRIPQAGVPLSSRTTAAPLSSAVTPRRCPALPSPQSRALVVFLGVCWKMSSISEASCQQSHKLGCREGAGGS